MVKRHFSKDPRLKVRHNPSVGRLAIPLHHLSVGDEVLPITNVGSQGQQDEGVPPRRLEPEGVFPSQRSKTFSAALLPPVAVSGREPTTLVGFSAPDCWIWLQR